jgi:hypothetical protein
VVPLCFTKPTFGVATFTSVNPIHLLPALSINNADSFKTIPPVNAGLIVKVVNPFYASETLSVAMNKESSSSFFIIICFRI